MPLLLVVLAAIILPEFDVTTSGVWLGWILVGFVSLAFPFYVHILRIQKRHAKNLRIVELSNVDQMTGAEFEIFLRDIFLKFGYKVSMTPTSGDFGIDLLLSNGHEKIAVQAKRYKGNVDQKAVNQVVAGRAMKQYGVDSYSMVVTNSDFTKGAKLLADANNCVLIGRAELGEWIIAANNGDILDVLSR